MTQPQITISERAALKIKSLLTEKGDPDLMLRVTIEGGGCSGFQYHFKLETQKNQDDVIFEHKGIKVVSDLTSLQLIDGGELDYTQDLMGAHFKINNPNAASSCGCGNSFSL